MVVVINDWLRRTFANQELVILALVLVFGALLVIFLGRMLAPVITALIFAYLLEGLVKRLERLRLPRWAAVWAVFLAFLTGFVFVLFGMAPLLSRQVAQLVQQIPEYLGRMQLVIRLLPERYPQLITPQQADDLTARIGADLAQFGQKLLAMSFSSVVGLMTLMVFLVLIPLLVFFFLKDKEKLMGWIGGFVPRNRTLVRQVWHEVDGQMGNYVRGKVLEILIVGAVTYVTFSLLGLQYAILLATITGFSVLIPYIGATIVTVPVFAVAFFQWGWGPDLFWVMVAYGIIQALDGNVLVPLLFSEVVDLHPVGIIIAILVFGGIWGFWGVFFAIPLATLVNAVLRAWPRTPPDTPPPQPE